MTTTPVTVTTPAMNSATVDVLSWFRQNHKNIENMLGKKLSSITLTYTQEDGYVVSYAEAPAAAAITGSLVPPSAPTA